MWKAIHKMFACCKTTQGDAGVSCLQGNVSPVFTIRLQSHRSKFSRKPSTGRCQALEFIFKLPESLPEGDAGCWVLQATMYYWSWALEKLQCRSLVRGAHWDQKGKPFFLHCPSSTIYWQSLETWKLAKEKYF